MLSSGASSGAEGGAVTRRRVRRPLGPRPCTPTAGSSAAASPVAVPVAGSMAGCDRWVYTALAPAACTPRLQHLEYLNMAVNNVTRIENLQRCESLTKLDLTINFVDKAGLLTVDSLQPLLNLRELTLMGNPCAEWSGYRPFVIAKLPQLKRLVSAGRRACATVPHAALQCSGWSRRSSGVWTLPAEGRQGQAIAWAWRDSSVWAAPAEELWQSGRRRRSTARADTRDVPVTLQRPRRACCASLQDGQDIKPSERIAAQQMLPELVAQLRADLVRQGIDPDVAAQAEDDSLFDENGQVRETGTLDEATGEMRRPWCPATRILDHLENVRAVWLYGAGSMGVRPGEPFLVCPVRTHTRRARRKKPTARRRRRSAARRATRRWRTSPGSQSGTRTSRRSTKANRECFCCGGGGHVCSRTGGRAWQSTIRTSRCATLPRHLSTNKTPGRAWAAGSCSATRAGGTLAWRRATTTRASCSRWTWASSSTRASSRQMCSQSTSGAPGGRQGPHRRSVHAARAHA